jgi:CCR4-NOT transcription complex subunit 2
MHPGMQSGYSQGGYQYDQGMSRFQQGLPPGSLQAQSREEEFTIQDEDFPALSGSAPALSGSATAAPPATTITTAKQQSSQQQTLSPMLGDSSAASYPGFPSLSAVNAGINSNLSRLPGVSQSTFPSPQVQSKDPKFGLLGLLDVVKMTDKDLSILSLGQDLASFGLNLNSSECLYASFTSPFAESSGTEPQYTVPTCYVNHPPSFKIENLTKIQIETLFYMFYSMPRDIMQAYAAQELYRREWRYHGELKLWLKQRLPQEISQSQSGVSGSPYAFFDVNTWEQRPFTNAYRGNLAAGFLADDEVRVRSGPATIVSGQGTVTGVQTAPS